MSGKRLGSFRSGDRSEYLAALARRVLCCDMRSAPDLSARPASTRPRRAPDEHDNDEGRDADLLQGLGQRPGRDVLARLAAELGRLGWPNALPRAEGLPRRRARPSRPWPIESGLFG